MIGPIVLVVFYAILYMNVGFEMTVITALMVIMINILKGKEKENSE